MIVDMRAKETESRLFKWFIAFNLSYGFSHTFNLLKMFGLIPSCFSERRGDTPTFEYIFYELFPDFTNIVPANVVIGIYFLFVDSCMTYTGVFNEYLIVLLSQLITRRFELLNGKFSTNVSKRSVPNENLLISSHTRTSRKDSGSITLRVTRNWLKWSVPLTTWLDSESWLRSFKTCFTFAFDSWWAWGQCFLQWHSVKFTEQISSSLFGMSLWESVPQVVALVSFCWRMLMLIFHAAKIHETSSETSRILNEIPADNILPEIRYFREYLATNKVVLTGRGFFALTKRLMLTVSSVFRSFKPWHQKFLFHPSWLELWLHIN